MSISIGSNGRISRGTNVVIPPENAGIGDVVLKSGSNILIIGRGTIATPLPSGYSVYGIIYGFVSGMAMICAPADFGSTMRWGDNVSGMGSFYYGGGTVLMRNGLKATYALMNLATSKNDDWRRGTAGTNVHPTAIYNGGVMTKATFEGSSGAEARKIYGTWDEYLRQTLRVQGAPGSPFGAVANGVKVHEFGRFFCKTFAGTQPSGTALRACYDYNEGNGTWWLPSMFELGELMIDEHLDKVEENAGKAGIMGLNKMGSGRWSCVPYDDGYAWSYTGYGMSNVSLLSDPFAVRPVSLLKL